MLTRTSIIVFGVGLSSLLLHTNGFAIKTFSDDVGSSVTSAISVPATPTSGIVGSHLEKRSGNGCCGCCPPNDAKMNVCENACNVDNMANGRCWLCSPKSCCNGYNYNYGGGNCGEKCKYRCLCDPPDDCRFENPYQCDNMELSGFGRLDNCCGCNGCDASATAVPTVKKRWNLDDSLLEMKLKPRQEMNKTSCCKNVFNYGPAIPPEPALPPLPPLPQIPPAPQAPAAPPYPPLPPYPQQPPVPESPPYPPNAPYPPNCPYPAYAAFPSYPPCPCCGGDSSSDTGTVAPTARKRDLPSQTSGDVLVTPTSLRQDIEPIGVGYSLPTTLRLIARQTMNKSECCKNVFNYGPAIPPEPALPPLPPLPQIPPAPQVPAAPPYPPLPPYPQQPPVPESPPYPPNAPYPPNCPYPAYAAFPSYAPCPCCDSSSSGSTGTAVPT